MSDARGRNTLEPMILRGESNLLISAAEVADKIENLVATREGTLRSVEGPAPLVFEPTALLSSSAETCLLYTSPSPRDS